MVSRAHVADIVEQTRITELIRKCKDVDSLERMKIKHPEKHFIDRINNKIKLLSIIKKNKKVTNEVEVEKKEEDLSIDDGIDIEDVEEKEFESSRVDLSPDVKKRLDEGLKALKKRGRKARR